MTKRAMLLTLLAVFAASSVRAQAQENRPPTPVTVVNAGQNPVPVTVVAPPPETTVICTAALGGVAGGPIFQLTFTIAHSEFFCSGGVTSIDVSRIAFTPDQGFPTQNVTKFRATVENEHVGSKGGDIVAVLTDGAPDAAVLQRFRFDSKSAGIFQSWVTESSGIAGFNVIASGTLILIGTPAQ